jgi:hypothetical protein
MQVAFYKDISNKVKNLNPQMSNLMESTYKEAYNKYLKAVPSGFGG